MPYFINNILSRSEKDRSLKDILAAKNKLPDYAPTIERAKLLPQKQGGIDWSEAIKRFRVFAAGAGQYSRGDWGTALNNANRSLLNYDLNKEQEDYNRGLLEDQNLFKKEQYENQLEQQKFQNGLALDKFNFAKEQARKDEIFRKNQLQAALNKSKNTQHSEMQNANQELLKKLLIPELRDVPENISDAEREQIKSYIGEKYPEISQAVESITTYKQPIDFTKYNAIERPLLNKVISIYNKDYDPYRYAAGMNIEKNIRDPDSAIGNDVMTAKTVSGHIGQLRNNINALSSRYPKLLNTTLNKARELLSTEGNAALNNLEQTVEALSSEYSRYLIRGKPAISSIRAISETFNGNAPVGQLLSAVDNIQELIDARTLVILDNYTRDTGRAMPISLLDEHIAANMVKRGWAKLSEDKRHLIPIKPAIEKLVDLNGSEYIDIVIPQTSNKEKAKAFFYE